jgi:hypothetical protein
MRCCLAKILNFLRILKRSNDTVQSCDTTQARSNSDFDVKFSTVYFYAIEHNSKSNRWIELELYQRILEVFSYAGIKFHVSRSSERTCNIGQNRLYEFCYLLLFDSWIFYMARILFLKDVAACFENFLVPQESLMS